MKYQTACITNSEKVYEAIIKNNGLDRNKHKLVRSGRDLAGREFETYCLLVGADDIPKKYYKEIINLLDILNIKEVTKIEE